MLNRILPLTESRFPLLWYWLAEWSSALEKPEIRRKRPKRWSFSDIVISILEWLLLRFDYFWTIPGSNMHNLSDEEAIRDTVKI